METEFLRSGMFPPSGMHTPFPKKRKNNSLKIETNFLKLTIKKDLFFNEVSGHLRCNVIKNPIVCEY